MTRMLLIDDERALLEGLTAYFDNPKLTIETASTIEQARERLHSTSFDLVLTDLRLSNPGGVEGLEILDLARADVRTKCVLMTGYATPEVEMDAQNLGAVAIFAKPLDLAALDRLVSEVVSTLESDERVLEMVASPTGEKKFRLTDDEAAVLLEKYVSDRDEMAFEAIARTFSSLVHSVPIKWYRMSKDEAEEVYQDVMLQLVQRAATIRNVRLWLIGTAVNCSRRRLGGTTRHERIAESWGAEALRRQSVHDDGEADLRESVREAVDSLQESQRRIVRAIYYEGLSYKEISARFGIPEGSIGPTRGRIVRALIEQLGVERTQPASMEH